MRRRGAFAFLLVAAAMIPSGARASHPLTIWERVANPQLEVSERVHRRVEELLVGSGVISWHTPAGRERLAEARQLLEGVAALRSPDVRLRFDLGKILSLLDDDIRAVEALGSALREAPDDPAAIDAYFTIAISNARLGRPKDEIAAYEEYLRRETDPVLRANALSNRGEAHMVEGDLAPAVDDYRASLLLTPDSVLAHWGLAVTLDRAGDRSGALSEVRIALSYDPLDRRLNGSDVFFVPWYDRLWYEGLGAVARAGQIDDPSMSILWWETAVAKWAGYLAEATAEDRWVGIAKSHLVTAQRELREAERRAGPTHQRHRGAGGERSRAQPTP